MGQYFIAVHAGAGFHSASKEVAYAAAMHQALRAAAKCLQDGGGSMDAVMRAICALEDAPVSNAGTGSNLTMAGGVECDASIMAGDGTQGAVGAVPGVTNPIAAAHLLATKSRQPLLCGLVPPTFVAGDAGRRWALAQGLPAAPIAEQAPQWLVTPAAKSAWQQYRNILAQAQAAAGQGVPQQPPHAATHPKGAPAEGTASRQQLQQGSKRSLDSICTNPAADSCPAGKRARGTSSSCSQTAGAAAPPACALLQPAGQVSAAAATAAAAGAAPPAPTLLQPPGQVAAPSPAAAAAAAVAAAGSPACTLLQPPGQPSAPAAAAAASSPARCPVRLADVCDTVGAVVVDSSGRVAAGVSSGGLALKTEGRVGEAAVVGAGCWAAAGTWQGDTPTRQAGVGGLLPGVAVSCSGVGERIMACSLAKSTGLQLQVEPHTLPTQAAQDVLRGQLLSQDGPWDAGVIAVRVSSSSVGSSGGTGSSISSSSGDSSSEEERASGGDAKPSAAGTKGPQQESGEALDRGPPLTVELPRQHQQQQQEWRQQQQQEQQQQQDADQVAAAGVAAACKVTARADVSVLRVEFAAAFSSPSFAVGYLAASGQQAPVCAVQVLRERQPGYQCAGGGAAAAGSGGNGTAPVPGKDVAKAGPPGVTCLEFCCSWPLQPK